MKQTIIRLAIAALAFAGCNGSSTSEQNNTTDTALAPSASSEVQPATEGTLMQGIITGYLKVKNALASDDANGAAAAGKNIIGELEKIDRATMAADQKKIYAELADDIKENAEHIADNAGKIDHQREHFEMLSKDVEDLVRSFGGGQKLYKDFCPMANDKKGAYWISEVKEIKNPYMGKEMPNCGEIKEELK